MNEQTTSTEKKEKKNLERNFLEVEDIMKLTEKSKHTCYKIIKTLKIFYDKKRHQKITINEFNDYFGID